jgi:hypothetical protein
MTPTASSSALPDYYGDERRARRRVRVRHALAWVGLIAGLAVALRQVGKP